MTPSSPSCRCKSMSTTSTSRSRPSTAYSTLQLHARSARRSAVQRHRAVAPRGPTRRSACRPTQAGGSTISTRCAPAFCCRASGRRSTPTPPCCRWTAPARRPSDQPIDIADGGGKTGGLYGVYIQDEWRILPAVTINYGLRLDDVNQYTSEGQASPRVNAVWKPTDTTTVTAGYSRYFVPPPFELVSPTIDRAVRRHHGGACGDAGQPGEGRALQLLRRSASARSSSPA